MTVLFIILLLMCAWHFAVQAIFIPNQAHDSRYKLYALRDRLRRLYIDGKIEKSEFQNLDEFASKAIKLYKNVTLYDIIFTKISYERRKSRSNQQLEAIFNCQDKDYIQVRDGMFAVSFKNASYNSLGWLPYIVIPFTFYFLYAIVMHKRQEIKDKLEKRSNIVVISAGDLPSGSYC